MYFYRRKKNYYGQIFRELSLGTMVLGNIDGN